MYKPLDASGGRKRGTHLPTPSKKENGGEVAFSGTRSTRKKGLTFSFQGGRGERDYCLKEPSRIS